jgi:hypothetical protein
MEPAVTGGDTGALLSAAVVSSEAQPRPALLRRRRDPDEDHRPRPRRERATGRQPGAPHQPGDPFARRPTALAPQLRLDPRRAVPALRPFVLRGDQHGQLGVFAVAIRGLPIAGGIVGGTGDLQQLGVHCRQGLMSFERACLWLCSCIQM